MALSYPWMEAAYQGVIDWNVSNTQQNPDRGAMKDALQASTAGKYVDYELSKGMVDQATESEAKLMQLSADMDQRNTANLMAKEHQFNTEGMKLSNELSKDYLGAETGSEIAKIGATGEQQRVLQETVNKGSTDVANIGADAQKFGYQAQADAAKYGADAQKEWTQYTADSNKTVGLAQTEADKYGADKTSQASMYGADKSSQASMYGADASKTVGLAQTEADKFAATQQADASRYSSDASRTVGLAQTEADKYGADKTAGASMYGADRQSEASKYSSDASRTVGLAQTEADKYGADRQSEASKYSSDASRTVGLAQTEADKYGADTGPRYWSSVQSSQSQVAPRRRRPGIWRSRRREK